MEARIGNIAGNFEDVDITCPRCSSSNVIVDADENGYFEVIECGRCGYKNYKKFSF